MSQNPYREGVSRMDFGRGIIFILTREDVVSCVREMDIPEEAITDEVLEEIKSGVSWGMEFWPDVVKEAIRIAIERQS